jgi:hypothetical protein
MFFIISLNYYKFEKSLVCLNLKPTIKLKYLSMLIPNKHIQPG